MLAATNPVTREEITTAIQELAAKLERRPTLPELCNALKINSRQVRKLFGTYARAVEASSLDPLVSGMLSTQALLEDWRAVARKLGRIPTLKEYELEGTYSVRPFIDRFRGWRNVPAGLLDFGDRKQLWTEWEDIRALAQQYTDENQKSTAAPKQTFNFESVDVNLLYGEPLLDLPMLAAPINEMGLVLLFGALARNLGFVVLKMQAAFPDCEALRQIDDNRWQRVRIEFEFQSRNFLDHGHNPEGCDLIVCWEHNWEGCTNQVLELKKMVMKDGAT
jgi:Homing endonuclease associated repeat